MTISTSAQLRALSSREEKQNFLNAYFTKGSSGTSSPDANSALAVPLLNEAAMDEESVLINRHKPALNNSKNR